MTCTNKLTKTIKEHSQEQATDKAGMDVKTARKNSISENRIENEKPRFVFMNQNKKCFGFS